MQFLPKACYILAHVQMLRFLLTHLVLFSSFVALEIISKSSCRLTLTHLPLSHCSVSEDGINFILQSCLKLELLIVSGMRKETVDKWLNQYPNVRISTKSVYDNCYENSSDS